MSVSNFVTNQRPEKDTALPCCNVARFPFNQKFRNFRNGGKWYGNFLGKFPKIVIFPKCKPFNQKFRKFREENPMERKFPFRNFRKFRYTSRGCPLSGNAEKCCSINQCKFPEIQTGSFGRMESARRLSRKENYEMIAIHLGRET